MKTANSKLKRQAAGAPASIRARLFFSALVTLLFVIVIFGLILDKSNRDANYAQLLSRLQSDVYALLSALELSPQGKLLWPDPLPVQGLSVPDSGVLAAVRGDVADWDSPSVLEAEFAWPDTLLPGESKVDRRAMNQDVYYVQSQGLIWEVGKQAYAFTLFVARHESQLWEPVAQFRRTMWIGLVVLASVLLLALWLQLLWSLMPLRQVAEELSEMERGAQSAIAGRYPRELIGLTKNLNALVASERQNLQRYRHTLGDLAHSLKTPLAVMDTQIQSTPEAHELDRDMLVDQIQRMQSIVAHQLKRAGRATPAVLANPVRINDTVQDVAQSLDKLHQQKHVTFHSDIVPDARFFGEQGDLLEVVGNLLDNAYKWAEKAVKVTASPIPAAHGRPGLKLVIEDDGPGVSAEQQELIIKRGYRADETVPGQGLGLGLVHEIVQTYGGTLSCTRSRRLGGAKFEVTIPPIGLEPPQ